MNPVQPAVGKGKGSPTQCPSSQVSHQCPAAHWLLLTPNLGNYTQTLSFRSAGSCTGHCEPFSLDLLCINCTTARELSSSGWPCVKLTTCLDGRRWLECVPPTHGCASWHRKSPPGAKLCTSLLASDSPNSSSTYRHE